MTNNSKQDAFQQLIFALEDFLETTPWDSDPDESGGTIHVSIDHGPALSFPHVMKGDAERLTEILRAATSKQTDQALAAILKTPRPQPWSLDHTRFGALNEDKQHISTMIERANRELSPLLLERFRVHLNKEVGILAEIYHDSAGARMSLKEHADQEMEYIHSKY